MDSEQKGNVQLFTGECLFLPVTICVVSEDEEDSWSFSDNSIKEGDYNSSDVDGDLTKLDACTSQEKSRASPYWLVDMNKFQDVQKGASKIVPDAIIQKVIGQKKKLFEENDARLQSKKDSDLKVSKPSVPNIMDFSLFILTRQNVTHLHLGVSKAVACIATL
ncbi:uncharacterized protein [Lepisosteus oculatus]|uniref:uncharacterized protein isoform X4 n=1 Tax=Lepisosteus oculatus TaxID=7918 RepID=UPI0035F522A9